MHLLIGALGLGQIISWGSLMYSIAVFGTSMASELGVSPTLLYGAFTLSLLASGFAAPGAGRLLDTRGARVLLANGSLLAALSLVVLAASREPFLFVLGWLLAGLAMAATLYDAAFAALNQIAGNAYRRAVTALTLYGGFASTVFWPLSLYLQSHVGWRGALLVYAALHLLICYPLHRWMLPRRAPASADTVHRADTPAAMPLASTTGPTYWLLAAAFAINQFVVSVMAVHVIELLKAAQMSAAQAVFVASLIGPMQVAGRVLEFAIGPRMRAVTVGTVSFALMLAGLLLLVSVRGYTPVAFAFAVVYGMSNGIMTIVRGTVPAELFGRSGYGQLLGRLARPAFFAKSLAPVLFAGVAALGVPRTGTLLLLAGSGAAGLLAYVLALRAAAREQPTRG